MAWGYGVSAGVDSFTQVLNAFSQLKSAKQGQDKGQLGMAVIKSMLEGQTALDNPEAKRVLDETWGKGTGENIAKAFGSGALGQIKSVGQQALAAPIAPTEVGEHLRGQSIGGVGALMARGPAQLQPQDLAQELRQMQPERAAATVSGRMGEMAETPGGLAALATALGPQTARMAQPADGGKVPQWRPTSVISGEEMQTGFYRTNPETGKKEVEYVGKPGKRRAGVTVNVGGKPASASERQEIASRRNIVALGQDALTWLNRAKGALGPVRGRIATGIGEPLGLTSDATTMFRYSITKMRNELIRLQAGANVPAQEFERMLGELPDMNLPPQKNKLMIGLTQRNMRRLLKFQQQGIRESGLAAPTVTVEGERASGPAAAGASSEVDAIEQEFRQKYGGAR